VSEYDELLDEDLDVTAEDYVTIDMSQAQVYEPLSGTFPVEIVQAKTIVTKANGLPAINLQLRVISGDHANRRLFTMLMLAGSGTGFTKRKLEAFGYEVDWAAPKISPAALVGLKATAVCRPDPRPGKQNDTDVVELRKFTSDDDI
jgi:hypothetical protein